MASSLPAQVPQPVTRRGLMLIIPAPAPLPVAILPRLCVRCGAAADGKPVEKYFYWHNPVLYVLLLSPIIYVIVALIVRKNMKVRVPLCVRHAQRRSTAVTLAWVLPLIGLADAFILPRFNVDGGIVALVTVSLMLTGLVIWAVVNYPIRPKLIDQSRGEFTGFCETFLQQFPEAVPQMVVAAPQPQIPPPPPI